MYDLDPGMEQRHDTGSYLQAQKRDFGNAAQAKEISNLQAYYEGKQISCEYVILESSWSAYDDQDNASLMYPIKITTEALEYDTVPRFQRAIRIRDGRIME